METLIRGGHVVPGGDRPENGELREELRRLIIEELSTIIRG